MRAKPADTCDNEDNYYCLNDTGHYIDLDCWINCLNQRISIYGHDVCPIPNTVLCRIEWDSPLPVELSSFSSSVNRNDVTLNWSTSKETNNSGFSIERYYEGQWKAVEFIAGSGTTSGIREYSYTDRNLRSGAYSYRLKQVDYNGNFEYFDLNGVVTIGSPAEYDLSQNYPNPFNPTTTIVYGIPADGNVTLKIYDNTGREIRTLVNELKSAGYYSVTFSAGDLASGMYFYKLESGNFVTAKKMILMK
ncbi:MAG: T9SS type A sorting domain-containing protein [Ignavibacteria bacterium]|nr:T9SS type A sorting domain-containing protein [Ignavibacteria bacterium]